MTDEVASGRGNLLGLGRANLFGSRFVLPLQTPPAESRAAPVRPFYLGGLLRLPAFSDQGSSF
jgi:hypothetical protein